MFGALYAAEGSSIDTLAAVAREFSPRIEVEGTEAREITLDLRGLARLFGDAKTMAAELRRTAADRGLRVRVAIAGTRTAARLLVHAHPGLTVVEPGEEPDALASIPLDLLAVVAYEQQRYGDAESSRARRRGGRIPNPESRIPIETLKRWGLRTLGDFVRLPADEIAARLGQDGVEWQRLARGEDPRPLVSGVLEERFEQALDLEWPIEGLEPLSFVLGRLIEPLSAHLERRDRAAAVLYVRLQLVTREVHERSLQLPAPIRDPRTLRTLALLDLESHPPSAAVDRVVVAVDPTPGRVLQFSLLTRPLPAPEQISTLIARLTAVMGEGRVGSAAEVDSWQPGAFEMKPFVPTEEKSQIPKPKSQTIPKFHPIPKSQSPIPIVALRRFRFPVPARVRMEGGQPMNVAIDRRGMSGGRVCIAAGPWRTSGGWWAGGAGGAGEAGRAGEASREFTHSPHSPNPPHSPHPPQWDRDEWDVTLTDGATYRLFRERETDAWFVEAVVD